MNVTSLPLINSFINMLIELAKMKIQHFSGAGFVLYHDMSILSQYHCNLVNDGHHIPPLKVGTNELMSYLIEISSYQHPYHDGFHFINGNGVLTHVAQFFSPPIYKFIQNVLGQGARTLCSQCGSNIDGVLMVGSVSTNQSIYLFENGTLVNDKLITFQVVKPSNIQLNEASEYTV